MEQEFDFRRATRRVLFDRKELQEEIPGAGKSAAEMPERHIKVKVTINLDGDIVQYFKDRAVSEGRAYQSLINQILREYLEGNRPEMLALQIKDLLVKDEKFLKQLAEQLLAERIKKEE